MWVQVVKQSSFIKIFFKANLIGAEKELSIWLSNLSGHFDSVVGDHSKDGLD